MAAAANTTEAPHVQLPDAFTAEMEDGTPVTSQNLLAYLVEYVEGQGIHHSLARAVVEGFSDDAEFQRLAQQRKCNDEILQYLFCERNYSERRVCFIVDLMAVHVIFQTFWFRHQLILSSGKLAHYWDQEKVEVCMCLKKFMCLTLWKLIGARLSKIDDEDFHIHSMYADWAEENEDYGCCLQRTILGSGRLSFLTKLRDAWTTPLEHVGDPHSCLNVLYPRASVLWHPPK